MEKMTRKGNAFKLIPFLILGFAWSSALWAVADNQSVRIDHTQLNLTGTLDALLIQVSYTPKADIHIAKACERERDVCTYGHYEKVCETHWHCAESPYPYPPYPYPYPSCVMVPDVVCYDRFRCEQYSVERYVAAETLKLNFDKKAQLKGLAERYFVLQCGHVRSNGLNLITNANDVRIRRGFWNGEHIIVKGK